MLHTLYTEYNYNSNTITIQYMLLIHTNSTYTKNEESEEKTIENEPNITATMSPPMRPNAGRTSTSGAHGVPPLKPNVNHGRPAATSSTSSTATSLQQSSNSSSNSPRHVIGNHVGSGVAAAASAGMSSATTASNSNWNCDSWADGEFEPLEEDTFAAGSKYNHVLLLTFDVHTID